MNVEGAETVLASACTDGAESVRLSAIDAIRERAASSALVGYVEQIVLADSAARLRSRALNILVGWLPQIPTIAETLRIVADTEENTDMRRIAAAALQRQRT